MRRIVEQFVKYPFYANIFLASLIIGGILAMVSMKMSMFPETTPKNIFVSVAYPGASPKEMEEGITVRVEEAVRGIVGIKEIRSTSSENFSSVQIVTTGEYDLDETLMEVKNAVDGISSFPVDAERPIVYKQKSTTKAMFMALYGDIDLMYLKKLAYIVEEDFRSSGILSQMSVNGYPATELSVEVREDDLLRYGTTFDEISTAIMKNNIDISAGVIKSPTEEILIRSRSRSVNPNIVGEIVVKSQADGSLVKIRDIADVKIKFADVTSGATLNGKPSISFDIQKLPEEDLKEITDFVEAYVEDFNQKYPQATLEITWNFMTLLEQRLEMLMNNGGLGLLLVVISLTFFLRFGLSFWVAMGIPASFFAMFMAASFYDVTINMISLFGMILVIGILVDDGIVIGENIFTHFEKGKSRRQAAVDGTMEVLPAVVTSVSTTVVAFVPVLLITQGGLEFMKEMAIVVIFSLLFSLFEAFFVLPAHLAHKWVLNKNVKNTPMQNFRRKLEKGIDNFRKNYYGRLLKKIITWRWFVVTIPIALFIMTIGMVFGGVIRATFFPAIPFDTFNVNIAFKPGTGEQITKEYLERYEDIVWEIADSIKATGDTLPYIKYTSLQMGNAFSGTESGSHTGKVDVWFHEIDDRALTSNQIAEMVRKRIGTVPEAEKFVVGGSDRFGKPVSVTLLSKNSIEMANAKDMLETELETISALTNISDNSPIGKQEIRIKLKPKAFALGLNQVYIANQVRQGFYGGQAQRLQEGKDEIRVWVRFPKEGRQNMTQFENMRIKTPQGEYPLKELIDYTIDRGPVSIKRYNLQKEITVEADLKNPNDDVPPILEKISGDIMPRIQAKYPGVKYEFMGQMKSSKESAGEMGFYFLIAFFVILLIIMIHFKSYIQAFVIISMVPIGWMGAAWGHGLEGVPISMLSVWGMVALAGVIVNDAVVFLSKYNDLIVEGMKVKEAAFEAGLARFRAIMLTTITTSIGLYPLILETSFQAQFLIPMAIALAYGVLFGTMFILIFFPALIVCLNDINCVIYRIWTGKECVREDLEPAMKNYQRSLG